MIFDLLRDFTDALAAMPTEHQRRRILKILSQALRLVVHFVDQHPTTLFQCAWNLCRWHGAERDVLLCLEAWANGKQQSTPGFGWIRGKRPPAVLLDNGPSAAVSLDGDSILSVSLDKTGNFGLLGTIAGKAVLFDTTNGQILNSITADTRAIKACALSQGGGFALACSVDGAVRVYRRDWEFCLLVAWKAPDTPSACALADNGQYACIGTKHGEVVILELPSGTAVAKYRHPSRSSVVWCTIDEPRRRVVSLDANCRIVLATLDDPENSRQLRGPESSALSASLLEDRNELVGVFANGEVWFWDLDELMVRKVQRLKLDSLHPFSKDLTLAVFGDSHVVVEDFLFHEGVVAWSLETGEPSGGARCQGGRLSCMTSVPDGSTILCGTVNGVAHCRRTESVTSTFAADPPGVLWDLASHRTVDCQRLEQGHFASMDAAGKLVLWNVSERATVTKRLAIEDLSAGDRRSIYVGKERAAANSGRRRPANVWSPPARMAYLPRSECLAIALSSGPIVLCRLNPWEEICRSQTSAFGDVVDLGLSPDEMYIVAIEQHGRITRYRCPELEMVNSACPEQMLCARSVWDACRLTVIFGPTEGGLSIWHEEEQTVQRIIESPEYFTACEISANGRFAWGSASGRVGMGSLDRHERTELPGRHRSRITSCAYSPGVNLLATTGQDGSVLIHSVSSHGVEGALPLSDCGSCVCWLDEVTLAAGTESGRVEVVAVTRGLI